jgi:hypothetical protein
MEQPQSYAALDIAERPATSGKIAEDLLNLNEIQPI